jgi:hypothetical protein
VSLAGWVVRGSRRIPISDADQTALTVDRVVRPKKTWRLESPNYRFVRRRGTDPSPGLGIYSTVT